MPPTPTKTYEGKPCKRCNSPTRYVSSRGCVACLLAWGAQRLKPAGKYHGKPCTVCGQTERYHKNSHCVACLRGTTAKRDKKHPMRGRARQRVAYLHMTDEQYWRMAARRYRSSTKKRLEKLGRTEQFPSIDEVHDWILNQPLVCAYCAIPLTRKICSLDHATPLARNGGAGLENVALACRPCNNSKGTMTAEEFHALRALVTTWSDGGKSVFVRLRLGAFNVRREPRAAA